MEIDTYEVLLDRLSSIKAQDAAIVAIEGACGSGKSTLAMQLARDLCGVRISTDSYIDASIFGSYLARIQNEFVIDDLSRFSKKFSHIMIEGICNRDFLSSIHVEPHVSVYVKKLAKNGLWHFEFELEELENGKSVPGSKDEPNRSDYEYHLRVKPHLTSEVVYRRIES